MLETKSPENMDITTVNEQGVQRDFANEEMKDQVYKKLIAERPFLLAGSHLCASRRMKLSASWSHMIQREKKR